MNITLPSKPKRQKHVLLPLENQTVKTTSNTRVIDWTTEFFNDSSDIELPTRSTTMIVPDHQVTNGILRADPHLARSELPKRARLTACEALNCDEDQLFLDYQRITINSIQWQAVTTHTINALLPKRSHHALRRIVPMAHACQQALDWLLPSTTKSSTVCAFMPNKEEVLMTVINFKMKSCDTYQAKPHLVMRKVAELPKHTKLLWINPEMIIQNQPESPWRKILAEALDEVSFNNWHTMPKYQDVFGNGKQARNKQEQDCAPWLPLLGAHLECFTRVR